jgi:hypothetical protein
MDPNENLKRQRELAKEIIDGAWKDQVSVVEAAVELAELVQALDEWRLKGGFDPYGASDSIIDTSVQAFREFHDGAADRFTDTQIEANLSDLYNDWAKLCESTLAGLESEYPEHTGDGHGSTEVQS